jgi:hypothetical protein
MLPVQDKNGCCHPAHEVLANQCSPLQVEQVAMDLQVAFYNKNLQKLTLAQFFETMIKNGTNIFLTNYKGELATSADTLKLIAEDLEV